MAYQDHGTSVLDAMIESHGEELRGDDACREVVKIATLLVDDMLREYGE